MDYLLPSDVAQGFAQRIGLTNLSDDAKQKIIAALGPDIVSAYIASLRSELSAEQRTAAATLYAAGNIEGFIAYLVEQIPDFYTRLDALLPKR